MVGLLHGLVSPLDHDVDHSDHILGYLYLQYPQHFSIILIHNFSLAILLLFGFTLTQMNDFK